MSTEQVALIPQCAECGERWLPADDERWQAHFDTDDEGHESAALALEVYSKVMERKRDTGERMDALVRGADWVQTGTNGARTQELAPALATRKPRISGASKSGR